MRSPEADVIVVGGGPAGAAAAIFMRQRGCDVLLLDEARFPRDKICGESVSPEGWRLIAALGAEKAVRELLPRPIHGMTLVAPDGTTFAGTYPADRPRGFALRRIALDAALLDAARRAGVRVQEGTRVTELLVEDGVASGVVVEGGDSSVRRARLIVGADGRRSRIARQLGLLREHGRLRKFSVRGHWDGVEGLSDHGEMHVITGGYCGVAPLAATQANVAFVLDASEMAGAAGDLEGFYRRTLRRFSRLHERLARASLTAPPRATGPLAVEARRLSAPGALLVGDAAGFYDPFTGEGITLALRSAELAAQVAAAALERAAVVGLREYDERRSEATRDKFLLNRLLQHVIAWPALANAVAKRLARRPDLADRLVGIAGDFIPARTALGPGFVWDLLWA
jgi:geranylgeranyl reductase family protein